MPLSETRARTAALVRVHAHAAGARGVKRCLRVARHPVEDLLVGLDPRAGLQLAAVQAEAVVAVMVAARVRAADVIEIQAQAAVSQRHSVRRRA